MSELNIVVYIGSDNFFLYVSNIPYQAIGMKNMNQSEKVPLLPSLYATCGGGYCDGIKKFFVLYLLQRSYIIYIV